MELKGKAIVVTGAARGLGQKMAEMLSGEGANLAVVDVDQAALNKTIDLCFKPGIRVKGYGVDVADEQAVVSFSTKSKRTSEHRTTPASPRTASW